MEQAPFQVILMSTVTIAVLHALAPDHWVPFVSVGRARGWSTTKVLGVTFVAGIAHTGSSIFIGAIGMALGITVTSLEGLEANRGLIAGLLLIGFGIAFAVWGLRDRHEHHHRRVNPERTLVAWSLIILFLLGPCEPLIPLMFASATHGWETVYIMIGLFSAITVGMMLIQTLIAYRGIDLIRGKLSLDHHAGHVIAGVVMAVTGVAVLVVGI